MMRAHPRLSALLTVLAVAVPWAGQPAAGAADPVLVGAGDIAACDTTADSATGSLIDGIAGTVFTLGDNAYPKGSGADFADCYDPAWGRHRSRTRPSAGNHDYQTAGANPYFTYFGAAAGATRSGWYSYDLGTWHIVVLDSNCADVGGCGPSSPQVAWLRNDLAANAGAPVLAYWHHPRYSSGAHGSATSMQTFWEVLYRAGAEVVLSGHDHDYERFAPQDPWGGRDVGYGIRQFVVGTGGAGLRPRASRAPNSEVFRAAHGVLRLTLRADRYDWRFVPVEGTTWTDTGSGPVHGARTQRTFVATADTYVDEARPRTSPGHSASLWVDGDTGGGLDRQSYLRFVLVGVTGRVRRATLRLWVTNATRDGPRVRRIATGWSEASVTWRDRPSAAGPSVADAGALAAGAWADFDVTPLVTRDGRYAFVLLPTSGDGLGTSSREGRHAPRLRVDFLP
jgi:hypothetical protein